MDKIKILYTGMSPNFGGIERVLINLCKYMDKNKFEISFLIFKGKKVCFQEELEQIGIKFFEVTHRRKNYFKFLRDLKKVYQENDFDYIHFNLMSFDCFERIVLADKYSKAKLIVHSHSTPISKIYKKTQVLDKLGRFMTRNIEYEKIACGEEAGKWLFGDKEFLILNNGIEVERFKFDQEVRRKIKKSLEIDENMRVFGHIGRFESQKNHTFLVDIFFEYQKMEPDSKLMLIGEGLLKNEIEEKVEKLGIQDKVLFLGRRNDTEEIYSAMDIFVMPSLFEGFGIVAVEAQINGLKCYASTEVPKVINFSENVKFLPLEKSAKFWADEIAKEDNARDEQAIQKVPDKFKIEETVRILSKIYEK